MQPINDQVIVITGASSGTGRETAIEFSKRGASIVLAARSAGDLQQVADEIRTHCGQAHAVVTDVAQWAQVARLAQEAVARFGRIATWVNNAAVAIYATVEQTTVEEIERLIPETPAAARSVWWRSSGARDGKAPPMRMLTCGSIAPGDATSVEGSIFKVELSTDTLLRVHPWMSRVKRRKPRSLLQAKRALSSGPCRRRANISDPTPSQAIMRWACGQRSR